jgi:transposase
MTRAKFEHFMRTCEPSCVVLEAGGSVRCWGRWFERRGHEVRLIAPQHVRAFARTNKIDRSDACAIWEAAQRPEMKSVAVKGEESRAVLGLHRGMREPLKQMRRNQFTALFHEFGIVRRGKVTAEQLNDWVAAGRLPPLLGASLAEQIERIGRLKREDLELRRRIERHNESDPLAMRLLAIGGIGPLGASALAAEFAGGRQFAAGKDITLRLDGTSGKVRTGPINKHGDPYLRTLLIHGARSVITQQRKAKRLSPWLSRLLARRPMNAAVVALALANKMARTAWALAAHARSYQENYVAQAA